MQLDSAFSGFLPNKVAFERELVIKMHLKQWNSTPTYIETWRNERWVTPSFKVPYCASMVVAIAQREKKCQNLDGFSIFGNFNGFQYSFFDQAKPTCWLMGYLHPFKYHTVHRWLLLLLQRKGRNGSKFMPVAAAIILQKMPRFSWGFNKEFHATRLDMQTHSVRNNFPCGFLDFLKWWLKLIKKIHGALRKISLRKLDYGAYQQQQ